MDIREKKDQAITHIAAMYSEIMKLQEENKRLRENYTKLKEKLWNDGICVIPTFDALREEGKYG